MKKNFSTEIAVQINSLIKKSIEYSFANYPDIAPFVKQHSQEMSEQVMRQHIDLYVNTYSINLGNEGKEAIDTLLRIYSKMNETEAESSLSIID